LRGINLGLLHKRLGPSIFSVNIVFHETLKSTNSLAKDLAAQAAPEGTLVLAEEQTAGRGRMGRQWLSPRYANLLFSLLLRPRMRAEEVFVLTLVLALAAVDSVEAVSGLSLSIKWPNDLYVGEKKLGGILTEFSVRGQWAEYVVLGLGVNVNWGPEHSRAILYPSTSILAETGIKISRTELLVEILKTFESYYHKVVSGQLDEFYERWNRRSMILGNQVEIQTPDGTIHGKASRIDNHGALIILDEHGQEQRVICGDVSVKLWGKTPLMPPGP
jgi:BirA family biotin operon repressor/biotin-[acetyl-CoA-carboxylase] ligase